MITTIYTIALLAIFTICMIVIFKKTSITSKVNKEKPTHLEVEQLKSKIDALIANSFRLIEESHDKSKRIAELIELCDKLQPDLVVRKEIKVDIDCDIKGINDFVFKTREQLNAWYLDKGLESVNRINEDAWKAMPGLNSTRSDQLIYSAIDDQIKNLMFRNIVDNASKLGVDLNEEFYNSQKQK